MAMGRPRSFDKDKALDQAMEVFWRKGYEGASLSDLTKAMGINPPSLYAAFGNKEGLLKAALDRYAEQRKGFLGTAFDEPTARKVAECLLRGVADFHTNPDNPPGCLFTQGGLACGDGAEMIPRELASRRAQMEAAVRERFERAKQEGDLPRDADPAALARYLSTVMQGMGVQAAAGATREQLQQTVDFALAAFPPPAKVQRARKQPVRSVRSPPNGGRIGAKQT
jgi:AcrR family transcriptional regulator